MPVAVTPHSGLCSNSERYYNLDQRTYADRCKWLHSLELEMINVNIVSIFRSNFIWFIYQLVKMVVVAHDYIVAVCFDMVELWIQEMLEFLRVIAQIELAQHVPEHAITKNNE